MEWTDPRIDDLARLVYANDSRLDQVEKLADAHDNDLKQMGKTGDRRRDDRRTFFAILLTVIAGDAAGIVLHVLGVG